MAILERDILNNKRHLRPVQVVKNTYASLKGRIKSRMNHPISLKQWRSGERRQPENWRTLLHEPKGTPLASHTSDKEMANMFEKFPSKGISKIRDALTQADVCKISFRVNLAPRQKRK